MDNGHYGCRFSITTDMAAFDLSYESAINWVLTGGPHASAAGGFVVTGTEEENGISLATKVFAHAGTLEMMKRTMSAVAVMQLFEVARDLSAVGEKGMRPWVSGPNGRVRTEPDEMCGAAFQTIRLPLDAPSPVDIEGEIEKARAIHRHTDGLDLGDTPGAFVANVELRGLGASGLMVAAPEVHVNYGPGVGLRFYYPLNVLQLGSHESVPLLLNGLSFDGDDGLTLFGSWALERPPGAPENAEVLLPTFVSFWPAQLFTCNTLLNAIGYAIGQGHSAVQKFAALTGMASD
jgi:hypothetical protein